MRKSILFKKSILIIIIVAMLGLFTGCSCTIFLIPSPGQTGTVHINITYGDWYYDIYLDSYDNYLGKTNIDGEATFYYVPVGNHTFYAEDDTGLYSGQTYQYIHSGSNYVNIYVYYNY